MTAIGQQLSIGKISRTFLELDLRHSLNLELA
jgi:hypothetical protein